jgi:hypothetical protein
MNTTEVRRIEVDFGEDDFEGRVESGRIQFNEDWPGVFFRGDDALVYASALEAYMNGSSNDIYVKAMVEGLFHSLKSCKVEHDDEE